MELTTRAAFLAPTKPVKRSIESKAMEKKKKIGEKKKRREREEEKKMDRCFSPRGTIMAKDELIWLHAERTALLPHVFDVIESLVFAKAIVPPFSPPAEKFRAALLPREINLLFRGSDSTRTRSRWGYREREREENKSDRPRVRFSIPFQQAISYPPWLRLKINSLDPQPLLRCSRVMIPPSVRSVIKNLKWKRYRERIRKSGNPLVGGFFDESLKGKTH